MKFGSCLLLLATEKDPLAKDAIDALSQSGYDYAEVSLARLFPLADSDIMQYRALFDEVNLPVRIFNNGVPAGLCLIAEPGISDDVKRYVHRALHIAALMGVDIITMSGPNRRNTPAQIEWESEGASRYIDVVKYYAQACASESKTLLIEPINERETSFISTLAQAERIVRSAGEHNLGIISDNYHFSAQNDDYEKLVSLCADGTVRHLHFADPKTRFYPSSGNAGSYAHFLQPLLKAGYCGPLSIEAHINDDLTAELQEGLLSLRTAISL